MNIRAFIRELNQLGRFHLEPALAGEPDMRSGYIADLMLKHGLMVQREATVEDCELEWCKHHDVQLGEVRYFDSDELIAFLEE